MKKHKKAGTQKAILFLSAVAVLLFTGASYAMEQKPDQKKEILKDEKVSFRQALVEALEKNDEKAVEVMLSRCYAQMYDMREIMEKINKLSGQEKVNKKLQVLNEMMAIRNILADTQAVIINVLQRKYAEAYKRVGQVVKLNGTKLGVQTRVEEIQRCLTEEYAVTFNAIQAAYGELSALKNETDHENLENLRRDYNAFQRAVNELESVINVHTELFDLVTVWNTLPEKSEIEYGWDSIEVPLFTSKTRRTERIVTRGGLEFLMPLIIGNYFGSEPKNQSTHCFEEDQILKDRIISEEQRKIEEIGARLLVALEGVLQGESIEKLVEFCRFIIPMFKTGKKEATRKTRGLFGHTAERFNQLILEYVKDLVNHPEILGTKPLKAKFTPESLFIVLGMRKDLGWGLSPEVELKLNADLLRLIAIGGKWSIVIPFMNFTIDGDGLLQIRSAIETIQCLQKYAQTIDEKNYADLAITALKKAKDEVKKTESPMTSSIKNVGKRMRPMVKTFGTFALSIPLARLFSFEDAFKLSKSLMSGVISDSPTQEQSGQSKSGQIFTMVEKKLEDGLKKKVEQVTLSEGDILKQKINKLKKKHQEQKELETLQKEFDKLKKQDDPSDDKKSLEVKKEEKK